MTCASTVPPTWRIWSASDAAISSVSTSVMSDTRSCGSMRRQVRMALRAPGSRSAAYTEGKAVRFGMVRVRSLGGVEVEAVARLFADVIDDLFQIAAGGLVKAELAVRP